jgi:hypothetical protein
VHEKREKNIYKVQRGRGHSNGVFFACAYIRTEIYACTYVDKFERYLRRYKVYGSIVIYEVERENRIYNTHMCDKKAKAKAANACSILLQFFSNAALF